MVSVCLVISAGGQGSGGGATPSPGEPAVVDQLELESQVVRQNRQTSADDDGQQHLVHLIDEAGAQGLRSQGRAADDEVTVGQVLELAHLSAGSFSHGAISSYIRRP